MFTKKLFLMLNACGVVTIALIYGISPQWFAHTLLGMPNISVDASHILRAVMGLYLALAAFWFAVAFKPQYHNIGIITFLLFAGGLVSGRILSLLIDGMPSPLLVFYVALELIGLPLGFWLLKKSS